MSAPSVAPTAPLLDPDLPVEHLLGAGAEDVIAAALAPTDEVVRVTPTGTTYHRGRSLAVRHDVVVRGADGRTVTADVVLSTGRRAPEGAAVVSDGEHDIVVWRVPHDPWLPGLAPALDPSRMADLLGPLGFPVADLRCRVRAYRPGRRAVVEVTGVGTRVFLKVVRPARAEALHLRHEALAGAVPVPASHGWSAEHGIVVLQALPGRTLRQVLGHAGPMPGPDAVVGLLDALPVAEGVDGGAGWRLQEFADHVGVIVPALAGRTAALAGVLAPFHAEAEADAPVPVHGDLYEAQLLVSGGAVTGLLDVDTFGTGRRVDDLATVIGHLSVLATTMPARRARIEAYARRLLDGFDRTVDPAVLRAGVAAVVLGLATGSFRVLETGWERHTEARVALAERWAASATAVRTA